MIGKTTSFAALAALLAAGLVPAGCAPTVHVDVKPITIYAKLDADVRVRLDQEVKDLIQKKFLNRQLPLPSGTGVNLTLDTTLNLDDLLADYAEFRKLHGSAKVQP